MTVGRMRAELETTVTQLQSRDRRGGDGRTTNTAGQRDAARKRALEDVLAKLAHAGSTTTLEAASSVSPAAASSAGSYFGVVIAP